VGVTDPAVEDTADIDTVDAEETLVADAQETVISEPDKTSDVDAEAATIVEPQETPDVDAEAAATVESEEMPEETSDIDAEAATIAEPDETAIADADEAEIVEPEETEIVEPEETSEVKPVKSNANAGQFEADTAATTALTEVAPPGPKAAAQIPVVQAQQGEIEAAANAVAAAETPIDAIDAAVQPNADSGEGVQDQVQDRLEATVDAPIAPTPEAAATEMNPKAETEASGQAEAASVNGTSPAAIADADAMDPVPAPNAAPPARPARLTTGASPTVTPQTELPAAHELQNNQTDDRAEAVTPRAVSVNDLYPQTKGPISELNPNPDLLYLPDTPEEVQIQLTQPITLRQAVEQAMSNSLTLRDTQLRLDRSRAQLREAQAAWAPVVSLQSALQRADSSSVERTNRRRAQNASPLNALLGTSDTVSRTLTGIVRVDWDIFTGGRRMANIRAAQQQVRISELEVKRQTDIIILDISNSYFDLQEADAQVRIAEAAVNSAQQSLRDAQLQFQAGVGTRFDVLRAEVQLANEKQNLTNRLAQQQIARRQLSQQLNVPQTVNLIASSNVQVAGTWTLPLEETIIQAYENRPGLEQRLAERELRLQQRRAELATVRPQLSTFADYDVLKDLDDGIGLTDGNTLGLRLSWRLYDGGAARARARQRSLEAQIAEVGFSDIRNQIRFEVERAYSNLLSNFENIDTARLAVDQAEEALRLARLRFQAGVGTQTEVIDAETDLTNARGNLLQAVINYNRSLATLERAVSLPIADSQSINEGGDMPVRSGSGS